MDSNILDNNVLDKDTLNNRSQKGASLVEYALLVALIAVIAIVGVRALGNTISTQFNTMNAQLG